MIPLLPLSLLLATPAPTLRQDAPRPDAREVTLALPADPPDAFALSVPVEGASLTLALARSSPRAEGFRVLTFGADGVARETAAGPSRTYTGTVLGRPGWVAAGRLGARGFTGAVVPDGGPAWFLEPAGGAAHRLYRGPADAFSSEACLALPAPVGPGAPPAYAPGDCLRVAELAFDVDFERFQALGGTVQAVLDDLDAVMTVVNAIYARDVLVRHVVTTVIVRTAEPDPYSSKDPGTILGELQNEWNTNQAGVQRDAAHLVTGKEMDGNIIGLAYVGVVCNLGWAYGLSQFTFDFGTHVSLIAHEVGHNWNAPHCDGSEGCGMMCGGCHEFTPTSSAIIMAYAANAGCVDDGAGLGDPVPPRAFDDDAFGSGPLVVDVLGNDHDGNCDTVVIDAFDATSAAGGTVTRSVGTGPGGRDELAYDPPAGFQGADTFTYVAGDGQGGQDVGTVTAIQQDDVPDLRLHLRLDDLGLDMLDSSPSALHGKYWGDVLTGVPGAAPGTGTAAWFDGLDDRGRHKSLEPMSWLRRDLTVLCWVRPDVVSGWRRFYGSGYAWSFGQVNGNLVFTTHGIKDYVSPVALAVGAWHHVAAVFDAAGDVTFYRDGQPLSTVPGDLPARRPGLGWYVGSREAADQFFLGTLDDVQVYDHALTGAQVAELYHYPGTTLGECAVESYCVTTPNSVGPGALMQVAGSLAVPDNDLTLLASGAVPGQFGRFFYGPDEAAVPVADGTLCVGGQLFRLPPVSIDVLGIASYSPDLANPPQPPGQIDPGSTWRFQLWYRDPLGGPAGSSFSDAVAVRFCP